MKAGLKRICVNKFNSKRPIVFLARLIFFIKVLRQELFHRLRRFPNVFKIHWTNVLEVQ